MLQKELSQKIKAELLSDFACNNRKGIYAATQKIMAYNSNKIEGSTLTSEQTASLFDTGTIVIDGLTVFRSKDIEEMDGHFKMFNQMLKYVDEPLSINLIKSYHYQLKNGVFEDIANGYPIGEFKSRANAVSDISTTSPTEVYDRISALLSWYSNAEKNLITISVFHAKYEHIHPFQDGNGRTGRMILFKQCLDAELVPVIIKDEDKSIYYHVLHQAQTEQQYEPLTDFFRQCQKQYLEYINNYLYAPQSISEPSNIRANPYIDTFDNENTFGLKR